MYVVRINEGEIDYICISGSASTIKILWLSCNSEFPFPTVPPQILDPPNNRTVVEPQDATFFCLATGRPRPAILWVRHSDITQLLPPSVDFSIDEEEIGDRERRSNLTIIGTQPSQHLPLTHAHLSTTTTHMHTYPPQPHPHIIIAPHTSHTHAHITITPHTSQLHHTHKHTPAHTALQTRRGL